VAGAETQPNREISRRELFKSIGKVVVGGALLGSGLSHIMEGAVTEPGRQKRAKAELQAQGITKPSSKAVKEAEKIIKEVAKKPIAGREPDDGRKAFETLSQKARFDIRHMELVQQKRDEEGHSLTRNLVDTGQMIAGTALVGNGKVQLDNVIIRGEQHKQKVNKAIGG
jgi:hypothetical protein